MVVPWQKVGGFATLGLAIVGLGLFAQTGDAMLLLFAAVIAAFVWAGIGVAFVLTRGLRSLGK